MPHRALRALLVLPIWRSAPTGLPEPLNASQVGDGSLALRTDVGLAVLDLATGAEVWRRPLEGFPTRPLVAGGRVYATDSTGRLVATEVATGRTLWTRDLGGMPGPDGLALLGDTLYVPMFGEDLVALDAGSGALRWTQAVGRTLATPALAEGVLLVGTLAGDLFLLDPATEGVRGRLDVGGPILYSPSLSDGLVFVSTDLPDGTVLLASRAP